LYRLDTDTNKLEELVSNLWFANGVVLSRDEDFILIAECLASRISKYWLNGPNKGKEEKLLTNLPIYPDNLSLDPDDDTFWVAGWATRYWIYDIIAPFAFLKKLLLLIAPFFRELQYFRSYWSIGSKYWCFCYSF